MAITWPTKEQIRASILALWQSERPDADDRRFSDLWLFSRIGSVLVHRLHRTTKQALDAVFPTTSFGNYLWNWVAWVGLSDGTDTGFGQILPGASSATEGLTCTATGGGPGVLANAWKNKELTDVLGLTYKIDDNHGAVVAGNTLDLDIVSVDTGYAVNLASGTTLTFTAPPAGSDSTAVTAKDLTSGTGLESESAGRTRLLNRLRNPPASGNVASWVAVIEAVSAGNLKAYVWPKRQNQPYGFGLVDFCALYTNPAGTISGTDRHILAADDMYTDIDDAVEAGLPSLIYENSRQLTLTSVPIDVDITTTLGSDAAENNKVDWDAEGNKTTVASNAAGGALITCAGNVCAPTVTDGLEVGHKVVINGVEGTVTAVNVGAVATAFNVTDWPDEWGAALNALAGYNVTSGGGFIGHLTQTSAAGEESEGTGLVEAVRVYFDTRGPNVSYNAAQAQIPGWDSSLRIKQIESACFVIGEGVIVEVVIDVLGGGVPGIDLSLISQDGATATIYDVGEITVWQVFV